MATTVLNSPTNVEGASLPNERDPLLPKRKPSQGRSFFAPSPLWIVPFWLIASFSRGMTLAPRVEVYTHLACQAYHHDLRSHRHPHSSGVNATQPFLATSTPPAHSTVLIPLIFPQHVHALDHTKKQRSEPGQIDTTRGRPEDDEDEVIARQPEKDCFTNPTVQQYAARLQTAVILVMGTLSALTTGWWTTVSDRIGRTKVMALSLLGYLFTDVMFLVVAKHAKYLVPFGGHKLLILGPFVEGLLGGWMTVAAAVNAYVSDTTAHGSRSNAFSYFQGILFIGIATGPGLGSLLIKWNPDILIVFAVSVSIAFVNCFYAAFVVPESLTDEIRQERERKRQLAQEEHLAHHPHGGKGLFGRLKAKIADVLEPAAIFLPRNGDWRLTFVGIAFFCAMLSGGLYPLKLLYAEHLFGWDAVQLGNYLTIIGSLRAVHLLVFMPAIIKIFKPKHRQFDEVADSLDSTGAPAVLAEGSTPTTSSTPMLAARPDSTLASAGSASKSKSQLQASSQTQSATTEAATDQLTEKVLADLTFDLTLARISIAIDALSYLFVVLVGSWSSNAFVLATLLSALGGGTPPVLQSIGLCLLPNPKEDSAKLFGALSMVSAIGACIISPLFFGLLYSETVKVFPAAIFVCGAALLAVGALALLLVRPNWKKKSKPKRKLPKRGRSTRRKALIGSASSSLAGRDRLTGLDSDLEDV